MKTRAFSLLTHNNQKLTPNKTMKIITLSLLFATSAFAGDYKLERQLEEIRAGQYDTQRAIERAASDAHYDAMRSELAAQGRARIEEMRADWMEFNARLAAQSH